MCGVQDNGSLGAVTLKNFSCNLFCNFVVTNCSKRSQIFGTNGTNMLLLLLLLLLLQSLREIELGCTSHNADCLKNIARHAHFRA